MSVASTGSGFRFGFQSDCTIPLDDEDREGFSLEATAGADFSS